MVAPFVPPVAAALMTSRFAPALWNMAGRGVTGLGNMIKGRGFRGETPYRNALLNPNKVYTGPTSRTGQFVNRHPYWTMAGAGTAGGIGYGLLSDGNEDVASNLPETATFPVGGGGTPSVPDNFVPNMMPRSEYLRESTQENIERMKAINLRTQIIKTAGGDWETYNKGSVKELAMEMKARGDIRNAEIVEGSLNKDGTVPANSKVLFDRLIKQGADPVFASEFSGYQLALEKGQASALKDAMSGQLTAKDLARKDVKLLINQQAYANGTPIEKEQAIASIISMLYSGEIPIEDKVTGFEKLGGDQYRDLAIAILSGTIIPSDSGTATELTEEDVDVFGISAD
tara:strand:+ start:147 stop:1175 length:1029 start_codon:yes stop_codon:yes gene_type:complete